LLRIFQAISLSIVTTVREDVVFERSVAADTRSTDEDWVGSISLATPLFLSEMDHRSSAELRGHIVGLERTAFDGKLSESIKDSSIVCMLLYIPLSI